MGNIGVGLRCITNLSARLLRANGCSVNLRPAQNMTGRDRFFVAVTGAQGVGKSTFCRELYSRLRVANWGSVHLLDGLGTSVEAMGVPLGSDSIQQTIFAVWTAHLEREASALQGISVLDRCVVDALAYTRALELGSDLELRLFERVAELAAHRLGLVLHLRLTPFFSDKGAAHETPSLRLRVAKEIENLVKQLEVPSLTLDADSDEALDQAVLAVGEALNA